MRSGETVSEMSAAAQFEHFRSSQVSCRLQQLFCRIYIVFLQTLYVSPSFSTISASGENAAQPHYKTTAESDTVLRTDHVYLVDSGAQYRYILMNFN